MSDIGRKKLIASLEGVFRHHIYNNNNSIRYPITFNNNRRLKGPYILRVTEDNEDYFFSGRYQFGANRMYVYQLIDALLDELESRGLLDEYMLSEVIDEYEIDEEDY